MTVSRLHGRRRDPQAFGRAKVGGPLLVLLVALRWYALVGVGVAIYSFIRALQQ